MMVGFDAVGGRRRDIPVEGREESEL